MKLNAVVGADIPDEYKTLEEGEMADRICAHKERLGERLIILTHQYQRPEIVDIGHYVGDSYELACRAGKSDAEYILFCGVQFMAQSGDLLRQDDQTVFHPDLTSGCPMADMGDMEDVEFCWHQLTRIVGEDKIVPMTYMNSFADLKAFVGKNGGCVCTSSNARGVFEWAYKNYEKVLFLPDEHLGRNIAKRIGVPKSKMALWNFRKIDDDLTGLTTDQIKDADLVLWQGYCHVHAHFTSQNVAKVKSEHPDATILVHPECREEVVDMADAFGSTSFIARYVDEAPAGSKIAVGTEVNLVSRLARDYASNKEVFPIKRSLCGNMFKISLHDVLYTLDNLEQGVNKINVPDEYRHDARIALERMLAID